MRIAVALMALALIGCSAPTVGGNELGGSVEGGVGPTSNVQMFSAAETDCGKYGRKARVMQSAPATMYGASSMTFECV